MHSCTEDQLQVVNSNLMITKLLTTIQFKVVFGLLCQDGRSFRGTGKLYLVSSSNHYLYIQQNIFKKKFFLVDGYNLLLIFGDEQ